MRFSLGQKIGSGFAVALLALSVSGVVSYRSTTNLLAHSQWVDHTHEVLRNVRSLLTSVLDAEIGARGYYLTGEDSNLETYRAAKEQIPATVRTIRALITDPSQQRRLDVLEPLLSEKLAMTKEIVELRREQSLATFIRLVQAQQPVMQQIRYAISEMKKEELGLLAQREEEAKASGKTAIAIIILASGLAMLLVSLSSFVIRREMLKRQRAEERQRAEAEELERRGTKLEAANKDLESFTYSVSHDLRAPLRHIDGFSRLLLEEAASGLSGDARGYLLDIRDSTIEMGRLVDDLLKLARISRQQLVLQMTGLGALVDDAVNAEKKANVGRTIEWKIGKLPFVECDPGLIKQVFVNLLSNAVKFTRPREVATINVEATTGNGQPVISVRDNGVGFNMKNAARLFGVFQRLHRQEDFEGTGAGLAIIHRIIQKHDGRVWAESELGRGTTFFFTLGGPKQTYPHISHAMEVHNEPSHLASGG
jgi:signal transduction histidine kinase